MSTPHSSPLKLLCLELFDLISYIIFVGGIVFFIRFFVINPYNVVGMSMHSTLLDRDFLLVDKLTPKFKEYQRGDIIVFVPPHKTDIYVKRIIGLPGETVVIRDNTVQICQDGETDCTVLEETYLADPTTTASCGKDTFPVKDGYFVMGDNRAGSTDSRCCFGLQCFEHTNYLVPNDYIIGKVVLRLYPNFTTFSNPF